MLRKLAASALTKLPDLGLFVSTAGAGSGVIIQHAKSKQMPPEKVLHSYYANSFSPEKIGMYNMLKSKQLEKAQAEAKALPELPTTPRP